MSEQRIFFKYSANEIRADLRPHDGIKRLKTVAEKRKNGLRKLMANLIMGQYAEMVNLFPEVIKFLAIEDELEVKRICHSFLVTLGPAKPGLLREAVAILLRDLEQSKNEQIRLMTFRTLAALRTPECIDETFKFISSALVKKSSTSMLKAVINTLPQMDCYDHERTLGLLETLYDLLEVAEGPPTVLVATLNSLKKIHEQNKNMAPLSISKTACYNLLLILTRLNEWDKALLLDCLCISYAPQSHAEAHSLIEMVVPQLQHANTSVILNCLKLITYASNYVSSIEQSLVAKISNSVIALLDKPPELKFLLLRNVILLLLCRGSSSLELEASYFFIEYGDQVYIKDTKLEILYLLATDDNLPSILNELKQYGTDIDIQMSKKAIRAIGNLAVKLEKQVKSCVSVLVELLEFGVDYVVQEVISVIKNVMRKTPNDFAYIVPKILEHIEQAKEPEAKSSILWIITEYNETVPDSEALLEEFACSFKSEPLEVQYMTLNCIVKHFVRNPSKESEKLCIQVLKCATNEIDDPDLRDRAFIYWKILTAAHQGDGALLTNEDIKEIVDGELPLIVLNNKLEEQVIEELELGIGTIASIYLKPASQVFRKCQPKTLPNRSALNPDRFHVKIVNENTDPGKLQPPVRKPLSHRSSTGALGRMDDYSTPAEKVNTLRKRSSTMLLTSSKLTRKPTELAKRFSIKKPF
ncbi:ADR342Cp [Eremothecium gossypii ATCC 10895]|uniref:AP complex subunit beta n=1 Tax=Eremothecium gossypii (strain ATCC 10895 / CBS 109.51 / FGSC 9923 / NRRL Y-1056) TaxID=284811 RepID=Q759D5_EREGS|nr:ADR342Cp [Eremothecium gossypii ATCC 10895]AAS52262.2 ADR342Cp [Eremothecium gossypii ATCC 10895]AEY96560.1 FADR342Cp [Eremothecium gossypii FDAG1]